MANGQRKKQSCGLFFRAWVKVHGWPTIKNAPANAGAILIKKAIQDWKARRWPAAGIARFQNQAARRELPPQAERR